MTARKPGDKTMRFLLHNCLVHPVAGLLWFFGLDAAGDAVHRLGVSGNYRKDK